MRTFKVGLKFFAAAAILAGFGATARAVDPFDDWANPPGWYAVDYPVYYAADKLKDKDGNDALTNLGLKLHRNVFRVTYYNKSVLPKTFLLSAFLPYDKVQTLGQESSGIGDLTLVGGYFPYDSDAPKSAFGVGFYLDAPTGSYDKTKAANPGANIWSFRPVLTYSRLIGISDVEASLKYNISTENDDTKLKNGNKVILELYNGYFLGEHFLVGGHFNYTQGADNKLNGQTLADSALRVLQAGGSASYLPTHTFGVMFQVLKDLGVRNAPDGILYLVRLYWKAR